MRVKLLLLLLAALLRPVAFADGLPPLTLTPQTLSIPTDVRPFQGPKEAGVSSVTYQIQAQTFGAGLILSLPKSVPERDDIPATIVNPYSTLLVGTVADRTGDKTARLLISAPECLEHFNSFFDDEYTERVKRIMHGAEKVKLLMAVSAADTIVVFYQIPDLAGPEKRTVFFRIFKKVGPAYLYDCSAVVSSPLILNLYGVLQRDGIAGLNISPK